MEKENKPVLSVRCDAELVRKIDALCERTGVGRAEIVERCLAWGLANEEDFVKSLESPFTGPIMHLLTHPSMVRILSKALATVGADDGKAEPDPTQMQVRENIAQKRRGRKVAGQSKTA